MRITAVSTSQTLVPTVSPSSCSRSSNSTGVDSKSSCDVKGSVTTATTGSRSTPRLGIRPQPDPTTTRSSPPCKSPVITTTDARLAQYLSSVGAAPGATVRPTEAQLRWAQFHRKKRASMTREKINALMQTPTSVTDVMGALPGDGETTEESCTSSSENDFSGHDDNGNDDDYGPFKTLHRLSHPATGPAASLFTTGSSVPYKIQISSCTNKTNTHVPPTHNSYVGIRNNQVSTSKGQLAGEATPQLANTTRARRFTTFSSLERSKHDDGRGNETQKGKREPAQQGRRRRRRRQKKQSKVAISRGRRALLRVSARATEERRKNVQTVGYSTHGSCSSGSDKSEDENVGDELNMNVNDILGDDVTVFSSSTATSVSRKHRQDAGRGKHSARRGRKRGRRHTPRHRGRNGFGMDDAEEEERVRRFEEAYHTIMLSMTHSNEGDNSNAVDEVMSPTKRWTRGSHVPVAVSVDGRSYEDLQRTPSIAHDKRASPTSGGRVKSPTELQDRGASWLTHVPRTYSTQVRRQGDDRHASPPDTSALSKNGEASTLVVSPGQLKFNEIVERLQQKPGANVAPSGPDRPLHKRSKLTQKVAFWQSQERAGICDGTQEQVKIEYDADSVNVILKKYSGGKKSSLSSPESTGFSASSPAAASSEQTLVPSLIQDGSDKLSSENEVDDFIDVSEQSFANKKSPASTRLMASSFGSEAVTSLSASIRHGRRRLRGRGMPSSVTTWRSSEHSRGGDGSTIRSSQASMAASVASVAAVMAGVSTTDGDEIIRSAEKLKFDGRFSPSLVSSGSITENLTEKEDANEPASPGMDAKDREKRTGGDMASSAPPEKQWSDFAQWEENASNEKNAVPMSQKSLPEKNQTIVQEKPKGKELSVSTTSVHKGKVLTPIQVGVNVKTLRRMFSRGKDLVEYAKHQTSRGGSNHSFRKRKQNSKASQSSEQAAENMEGNLSGRFLGADKGISPVALSSHLSLERDKGKDDGEVSESHLPMKVPETSEAGISNFAMGAMKTVSPLALSSYFSGEEDSFFNEDSEISYNAHPHPIKKLTPSQIKYSSISPSTWQSFQVSFPPSPMVSRMVQSHESSPRETSESKSTSLSGEKKGSQQYSASEVVQSQYPSLSVSKSGSENSPSNETMKLHSTLSLTHSDITDQWSPAQGIESLQSLLPSRAAESHAPQSSGTGQTQSSSISHQSHDEHVPMSQTNQIFENQTSSPSQTVNSQNPSSSPTKTNQSQNSPESFESCRFLDYTWSIQTEHSQRTREKPASDDISLDMVKRFNQKVLATTAKLRAGHASNPIIDTDEKASDASNSSAKNYLDPSCVTGSLILSPTILTKRHQQAVRAVELRNWEQVVYLLNANPWLAEMTDIRTSQFLLHKLAFHGSGDHGIGEVGVSEENKEVPSPAPSQLNLDIIETFPGAVQKFDQQGNLPLHMAAASANMDMIKQLGERFPGGASVRNNDGMLPLHLAIMSCAFLPCESKLKDGENLPASLAPVQAVKFILGLFPGAISVADNERNLPLHIAAESLHGDVGVEVIYMLLDEENRRRHGIASGSLQLRGSEFSKDEGDDKSIYTVSTATATDPSSPIALADREEESTCCNLSKNEQGHTPLMSAIHSLAGWQVVEALVNGTGGQTAALVQNENKCNALHLLVRGEYADPASVLSILKVVPGIASILDGDGILPIETACVQMMPREVILALVLVDLPIDLDVKDGVKLREGYGGSWWFLTCECDDAHVDVVREVLSICSYEQKRELCFMKGGSNQSGGSLISRATPKCRLELRKALRFVGRFEFMGSTAVQSDPSVGLKVFDALDFGTDEEPYEDGRKVLLKCYGREQSFVQECALLREIKFDTQHVEKLFHFCVHEFDAYSSPSAPRQFCIAVERPDLTLSRVISGMLKNQEHRLDQEMFDRYMNKVTMVLRLIGKAIRHLHQEGVVHGDIGVRNCGKFGDKWKLLGLTGTKMVGEEFTLSRMGEHSPPEAVELVPDETKENRHSSGMASFRRSLLAEPSADIWAFGKLAYEVLVGEPLIVFDHKKKIYHDRRALVKLGSWNETNLREVVSKLEEAGVSPLGADLISHCLCPSKEDRPATMEDILKHPFWRDTKRRSSKKSSSMQRKGVENKGISTV